MLPRDYGVPTHHACEHDLQIGPFLHPLLNMALLMTILELWNGDHINGHALSLFQGVK